MSSSPVRLSGSPLGSGLLKGLGIGLSLGLVDAAIALVSGSTEFPWLSCIPPGVLTIAGISCGLFMAALLLARGFAPGLFSAGDAPFAASGGMALLLCLIVAWFPVLIGVRSVLLNANGPLSVYRIFAVPLVLALAAAAVLVAYRLSVTVVHRVRGSRLPAALSTAVPLFLAELTVALWCLRSRGALRLRWLALALALAVVATVAACFGGKGLVRARALVAGLAGLVLVAALAAGPLQKARGRAGASSGRRDRVPRVILITVDTLRADALSCYGSSTPTPSIDRLASEGVLFRNAYAPAPWTLPSLGSMMTGLSPWIHRYQDAAFGRAKDLKSYRNLAGMLQGAGYVTAAFNANPIIPARSAIADGFDEYHVATFGDRRSIGGRILGREPPFWLGHDESARRVTQRALGWLDRHRTDDFFLWVHYFDPHEPYAPPADLLPKSSSGRHGPARVVRPRRISSESSLAWIKGLYAGEVRCVDESVGTLLRGLADRELYEGSLILFSSDHGEEFLDHGGLAHGYTLFEESIRVPLIVRLPGAGSGRIVEPPVSTTSLPATILEICAVRFDAALVSSQSLVRSWARGGGDSSFGPVLSTGVMEHEEKEAVVLDRAKYIRSVVSGHEELYDLAHDPQERSSIADSSQEIVLRARKALAENEQEARRLEKRLGSARAGTSIDETMRQLRALGYLR